MELKEYKLGDIAEIINGSTPTTTCPHYYDGDIVWITPKDLSEQKSKYIEKGERNITEAGFNSCSTHLIPKYNILLTSRAPIGLLAINKVACCTNQGFKNLIVNKDIVDVDYLYYYLKYHIAEIEALGTGTTFKEVSKVSMEKYTVSLPDLEEQKKVSSILSALDAKISLNRQINQNLEALARQLYDYWFVQFDFPNEEGKPYKSSGGKMVYNPILKREIPEGWEVKTINEIAQSTRGVTYNKSDLVNQGVDSILVLRGNNIEGNSLVYDGNVAYVPHTLVAASQRIKKFDIIMTMSSGSKAHIGKCVLFNYDSPDTFGAFLNKFSAPQEYVYLLFLHFISNEFKSKIQSICNGTGINNLTNESFNHILLPTANEEIRKHFKAVCAPIFDSIGKNELEIVSLTKQRDELLPLLMNGQVNFDLSDD